MGCNDATTSYFAELRLQLGTPPAPALVADSLTATSLKLEWHFPEAKKAGLRYLIQWKYEEIAATWQFCRNQTWGRQDTVFVENLQPYTKYRVSVLFNKPIYSEHYYYQLPAFCNNIKIIFFFIQNIVGYYVFESY